MRKINLVTIIIVFILLCSVCLFAFGCDKGTQTDNSATKTVCTEHVFTEAGYCEKCGTWDGVSTPCVEDLDSYCDSYLPTLIADQYRDYAKTVDFDFEKDPELRDQGLYWTWYDEDIDIVREVSIRDTAEVDEMIEDGRIDKTKPTIIFVHGICVDQHTKTIVETVKGAIELPSDGYGLMTNRTTIDPTLPEFAPYVDYTGNVNLNLVYLKNNYNVLNFVYTRFAEENISSFEEISDDGIKRTVAFANNCTIEQKVYSTQGKKGMRYINSDGVFSNGLDFNDKVVEDAEVHEDYDFCIAEYFAAEYIRMYSYMVQKGVFTANTHVGIACHSMGGVVTTMGTFLLSELVRVGQIPADYMPDRIALEDSYFGVYTKYGDNIPSYSELESKSEKRSLTLQRMLVVYGIECSWSGKTMGGGGTAPLYLTALRQIVRDYGVVVEYYVDECGVGNGGINYAGLPAPTINMLIREYTSTIAYVFKFKDSFNSHNGIREEHICSFLYPVYKDVDGNEIVSAAATDDQIRNARGKQWYQYRGNTTSTLSDDVFKAYEGKEVPNDYER